MNTTSVSHADAPASDAAESRMLVWDAPVRVVHWLMALCFAGAYLTAENDSLRAVHVTLGYTMAGLVGFRLIWGLAGTRYARFSQFIRGPGAALRYLRSLFSRHPEHHVGHNPAGALAIIALLGTTVLLVASGWANYNDIAGHWTEEVHEAIAGAMLALVGVHVGAVLLSSVLHRENLVASMISGTKPRTPGEGIRRAWRGIAAVVLAAVLGFWWWQWQAEPAAQIGVHAVATQHHGGKDDDD